LQVLTTWTSNPSQGVPTIAKSDGEGSQTQEGAPQPSAGAGQVGPPSQDITQLQGHDASGSQVVVVEVVVGGGLSGPQPPMLQSPAVSNGPCDPTHAPCKHGVSFQANCWQMQLP
jgi:hypothetical protein